MSLPRKVRNYVEVKHSLEARYDSLISNAVHWSSDLINVAAALRLLREMDMIAYQFAAIRAYLDHSKARLLVYDSQFIDEIELYRSTLEKDLPIGELIAAVPALAIIRREYRENAREGGKMAHQVAVFPGGALSSVIADSLTALLPQSSPLMAPGPHGRGPIELPLQGPSNPLLSAQSAPASRDLPPSSGYPRLAFTQPLGVLSVAPEFPEGVLDFLEPQRKKIRLTPVGFLNWTLDNVKFLHSHWAHGYAYVTDKVLDMYGVKLSKNALVYLGAHYGFDKHRIPAATFRALFAREIVDLVDVKQLVGNLRRRIGGDGFFFNSPVLGFGLRFHSMLINLNGTSDEPQSHFSLPPIDPTVPPEESARTPPPDGPVFGPIKTVGGLVPTQSLSSQTLSNYLSSINRLPSLANKSMLANLTTFEPVFGGPRASLISHIQDGGHGGNVGHQSRVNLEGYSDPAPRGAGIFQNRVPNLESPSHSQRAPTAGVAKPTTESNVSQPNNAPKTPLVSTSSLSPSTNMPPIRTSPPRNPVSGYRSLNKPRPNAKPQVPSLDVLGNSDESTSNGSTPPPEEWSRELLQHFREATAKVREDDPYRVKSIQVLLRQATGLTLPYEHLLAKLKEERLGTGVGASIGPNLSKSSHTQEGPRAGATSSSPTTHQNQHLSSKTPVNLSAHMADVGDGNTHFAMAYGRQHSRPSPSAHPQYLGSAIGAKTATSSAVGGSSFVSQASASVTRTALPNTPPVKAPVRKTSSDDAHLTEASSGNKSNSNETFNATPAYNSTSILFGSEKFYQEKFSTLDNSAWTLDMNRILFVSMEYLANPNPVMTYSTVKRTALGVIQIRLEKEARVRLDLSVIKRRSIAMLRAGIFGQGAAQLVRDCCN